MLPTAVHDCSAVVNLRTVEGDGPLSKEDFGAVVNLRATNGRPYR